MLARKALAGTAGAPKVYVEDVFSTYLYTGNGSTQTITNNIDLSGKGGLVWAKVRTRGGSGWDHTLVDTVRGQGKAIYSNLTNGQDTGQDDITGFLSNGFTTGSNSNTNHLNETFASWTFRKAKKFFDVVTYTGNNTSSRAITHNLGSTPGAIFIKKTSAAKNWAVYHRSSDILCLNSTAAAGGIWSGDITSVNSASFTVENYGLNDNGDTYVAYLFAHDAGGFGDAGSDNVISCGSFTVDGSGNCSVSLGYEPQWLMVKSSTATDNWYLFDNMRGFPVSPANGELLRPNTSGAGITASTFRPTATGFTGDPGTAFGTGIYIAIRRGPMKTPETGTSVYNAVARSGTGAAATVTGVGFPVDLLLGQERTFVFQNGGLAIDRLRGSSPYLFTSATSAEASSSTLVSSLASMDGFSLGTSNGLNGSSGATYINWAFRRAPGFFDVVCYTGTGSARTVTHNLGAVPELMIVKARTTATGNNNWVIYASGRGATEGAYFTTDAFQATSSFWNDTTPTSSVFSLGTGNVVNQNTITYVAYLFASLSGVSKIGTYTGNGSSVTVTTNFQPRFILVKRTDSTGNWIVSDSARGLVSGSDPYLLLNSTAAEDTDEDWVDVSSTSFTVNQTTASNANVNTGTYIYLAIA